jgi:predicted CXXCH cytochrome family protein
MRLKKNDISFKISRGSPARERSHFLHVGKNQRWFYFFAGLVFILALIVTACSPKMGNGTLKFFFDGVPEKPKQDSLVTTAVSDTANKTTRVAVPSGNTETYYHAPYKDGACTKCHDSEAPGKTTFSQGEFCYNCHTDFQKKYEVVHGPVAAGFCTACHAPHLSNNKKLLLNKGQAICVNCHTLKQITKYGSHEDIGNASCTECHNPHGGSDRYLSN